MENNELTRQNKFASDETLVASLAPDKLLKDGFKMMAAIVANKYLPPEKMVTLPL